MDTKSPKKVGPIIVIFVIIVIIIALALYFFASKSNNQQTPVDNSSVAAVQPITNTSDDIQSIQNDLNNSTKGIDSQNF
jgi:uncharacterized protein YpmB